MTDPIPQRQAHATLDLASRRAKGMKIERLLGLSPRASGYRVLEVGTGAGGIAHYFASHPLLNCSVDAVDVNDNRQVMDGYRFQHVHGVELPYGDDSFDVVISNHVIEHVGGPAEQLAHLQELARVLAPGGCGYLAVPNRWMVVEPHFRLAFLSWLPHEWRSTYVRLRGRGVHYDCEPLMLGQLQTLMVRASLRAENIGVAAIRETLAIEHPGAPLAQLIARVPDGVLSAFRRVVPTLIFRFERFVP